MVYLRRVERFLGFVLALIVAIAAFTPCCTGDELPHESVAASQHDAPEGDDGCTCSPFFACATCPGFISTAQPIIFPAPVAYFLPYYEDVFTYFSSAYPAVPWQPPRAA